MLKPDEIEIRRIIYKLIKKNPGLHASKIADILRISGQLTDYHLLNLEREQIVTPVKEKGYRRYYLKGEISRDDRKKLSILRQETPLKIILLLLKHKSLTHKEIHSYFDIAASTLSYHIQKLVKINMITFDYIKKEKRYKIINEKEVKKLLIEYEPHSTVDNFSETWFKLTQKK